jgi:osmotically-inducible protein OsmY
VNAGEIEVLVEGGEVTSRGSVEQQGRALAHRGAGRVGVGVSLVHNRVRIAKR